MNFFKYAQVEQGKRKAVEKDFEVSRKKRRLDTGQEDDGADKSHEEVSTPLMRRHRIKMKGLNVPSQADTFGEMKERYDIPPQLFSNLSKCGYSHPTSIQSSGMPVLFEVLSLPPSAQTLITKPSRSPATLPPYPQLAQGKLCHISSQSYQN